MRYAHIRHSAQPCACAAVQLLTCACRRSSLAVSGTQPGTGQEGVRQWKQWISDARKSSLSRLSISGSSSAGREPLPPASLPEAEGEEESAPDDDSGSDYDGSD